MSTVAIVILAFGMSIDAFVASLGRGAGMGRPRIVEALRTGAVFGVVEAITPLVGWLAGVAASRFVEAVDHWIAFGLLAFIGGRMIVHALRGQPGEAHAAGNGSLLLLVATALGTSIDAMVVGVSLAFLDVNILIAALAIGAATFAMSTAGMLLGPLIGARFGPWAEIVGGTALIGLGLFILVQHLSF